MYVIDDSYLEHYGIKGQKRGVRRGPPYPLNEKAKTQNLDKRDIRKTPEQLVRSNISRKTLEEMKKIYSTLSSKEKNYVGDASVSKYTEYAKIKNGAYIVLDDYHGKHKDEHPYSGKIVGIAASKESRGTGATDQLIRDAIKANKGSRLIAEIDSTNVASQKLFQRNGFSLLRSEDGIDYYVFDNRRMTDMNKSKNEKGEKWVKDHLKQFE